MIQDKGILSTTETTSVIDPNFLLKAENVEFDSSALSVRKGITYQAIIGSEDKLYKNIAIKAVKIASQDFFIIVDHTGKLYGYIPGHVDQIYKIKRRYYNESIHINLADTLSVPTVANILEMENYIYIVSNVKSYVIYKDGFLDLGSRSDTNAIITVDALDATIKDLDYDAPKLEKISNKYMSQSEQNTRVFVRNVSEFGGRGYPSDVSEINEQGSYFIHGIDQIPMITNTWVNGFSTHSSKNKLVRIDDIQQYVTLDPVPYDNYYYAYYITTMSKSDILRFGSFDKDGVFISFNKFMKCSFATQNTFVDAYMLVNDYENILSFSENNYYVKLRIFLAQSSQHTINKSSIYSSASYIQPYLIDTLPDQNSSKQGNLCVCYVTKNGEGILTFPDWTKFSDMFIKGKILTFCDIEDYIEEKFSNITQTLAFSQQTFEITSDPYVISNTKTTGFGYSKHKFVFPTLDTNTSKGYVQISQADINSLSGYHYQYDFHSNEGQPAYVNSNASLAINIKINTATLQFLQNKYVKFVVLSDSWDGVEKLMKTDGLYIFSPMILGNYETTIANQTSANCYTTDSAWLFFEQKTEGLFCNFSQTSELRYSHFDNHCFEKVDISSSTPKIKYNNEKKPALYLENLEKLQYNAVDEKQELFDVIISLRNLNNETNITEKKLYELYVEEEDFDILVDKQYNKLEHINTITQSGYYTYGFPLLSNNITTSLYSRPLVLSRTDIFGEVSPKNYTRSIGDFIQVERWTNNFVAVSGNDIKVLNSKLEWDETFTISIPSNIKKIETLNESLYVCTDSGIYVILPNFTVEFLSSINVKNSCVAGTQLIFVDENGDIYKTEFTPIPVQKQSQQSQNPYILVKIQNEMIKDISENWNVLDVKYCNRKVYFCTESSIYILNIDSNSFYKYLLPVDNCVELVVMNNDIYLIANKFSLIEILENPAIPTESEGPLIGGG